MADLTDNKFRVFEREQEPIPRQALVKAGEADIYVGAVVALDSGGTEFVHASATERCVGIAQNHAAAGEELIVHFGHIERLPFTGATSGSIGVLVYATDDSTLTLTPNTCIVGLIVDVPSDGTANQFEILVNTGH